MLRSRWALTFVVLAIAVVAAIVWFADDPEASCGTPAGPTAVVGIGADGSVLWTHLAGHTTDLSIANGLVHVTGGEIEATFTPATGDMLSCADLDQREVDLPAAATSLGPADPGEPIFIERVTTTEWRILVATEPIELGGQTMHLAIETHDGERLWDAVLPGFVVDVADDQLLLIDQTDGTGRFDQGHRLATRLTSYDIASGDPQWHANVPGAPYVVVGAGDHIVIPGTSELYGLDRLTGEVRWQTDLGNPGRTRHYSEPGFVNHLEYDEPTGTVVASIRATAVYRD